MLAMRAHHAREPLRADRVEVPLPGPGEVLLRVAVPPSPLARANDALQDLRAGRLNGAAVLVPGGEGAR